MFIKIIILIELTLSHVFLKFIEINDIGIRDNSKNIKNMTMLSDRMHNVIIITLIFIMYHILYSIILKYGLINRVTNIKVKDVINTIINE